MKKQPEYSVAEVVWAKIRGYPWWPGIVNSVQNDDPEEVIFKVSFFGDTTHAFLDETKVAKFEANFTQYEAEGRNSKKLLRSIAEAEAHLKENKIQMNLIRKPLKVKPNISRKQSVISQVSNSVLEISSSEPTLKQSTSKQSIMKKDETAPKKQDIIVRVKIEKKIEQKIIETKKPEPKAKNTTQVKKVVEKQISIQSQSLPQKQPVQKKVQIPKQKSLKSSVSKIEIKAKPEQPSKQNNNKFNESSTGSNPCPKLTQKLNLKISQSESADKKERKLKIQQLIQEVKKYATSPEQIINYLSSLDINTENIKQILDCDVVQILHNTPCQASTDLMTKMRSILLERYFSDEEDEKQKIKPNDSKQKARTSKSKNLYKRAKPKIIRIRQQVIQKLEQLLGDSFYSLRAEKANDEAHKFEEIIYEKDNTCGEKYDKYVGILVEQLGLKKYPLKDLTSFLTVFLSVNENE